jgi:hypothetical protein
MPDRGAARRRAERSGANPPRRAEAAAARRGRRAPAVAAGGAAGAPRPPAKTGSRAPRPLSERKPERGPARARPAPAASGPMRLQRALARRAWRRARAADALVAEGR